MQSVMPVAWECGLRQPGRLTAPCWMERRIVLRMENMQSVPNRSLQRGLLLHIQFHGVLLMPITILLDEGSSLISLIARFPCKAGGLLPK